MVEGQPCYPAWEMLHEKPEGVLVIILPALIEKVVLSCIHLNGVMYGRHLGPVDERGRNLCDLWNPGSTECLPGFYDMRTIGVEHAVKGNGKYYGGERQDCS